MTVPSKPKPPEKARFPRWGNASPSSAEPSLGSKTMRRSERYQRVELRKNKPKNKFILEDGNVRFAE